jgi:hypothetical protein
MPYDDLRKGRWSERSHAYFVTTALADRQLRWFADFWCARLVIAEMRDLHDADAVGAFAAERVEFIEDACGDAQPGVGGRALDGPACGLGGVEDDAAPGALDLADRSSSYLLSNQPAPMVAGGSRFFK